MVILVLMLAYAISVAWCWYETKLFFNRLYFVRAETVDVITCFLPLVNLINAMVYFCDAERHGKTSKRDKKEPATSKIADCFFQSNKNKKR